MLPADIDAGTLRTEIDRITFTDSQQALRLAQIVVLLEVADEARRKAEVLLARLEPERSRR